MIKAGVISLIISVMSIAGYGQITARRVEDLRWLAGCWESAGNNQGQLISEQWMKPAGGTMIGAGRTVRNGKTTDYEFVRIVQESDGIYYVAKPKAQEETRFKLVRSTASEIVFENPAHDFPQRVMYNLKKKKLAARIEGLRNGKLFGIDFPMVRTTCE
ncbi:MAG: DUF6265 family protein [Pyrinomonadaceae bacterium]